MKINKAIFYVFITVSLVFPSVYLLAEDRLPSIGMTISSAEVAVGSEVEFKMFVTAPDSINAFDITLVYEPDLLEFVRGRTDRSIASIWQSLPIQEQNGKLRLIGGMTTPFSGKNGEIISLIFKAIAKGNSEIIAERADLALADGKGTLLSGGMGSLKIKILDSNNNPILIKNNEPAPNISDVVLSKDPSTNDSIILIRTENDGGIKEIQVRSRAWLSWGDWEKSSLTASFSKNAWALEIKAIGFDATESSKIVYIWSSIAIKFAELIGLIILGLFLFRRIKNYGK